MKNTILLPSWSRVAALSLACALVAACGSDNGPQPPANPADNSPGNDRPDKDFVGEPAELPAPPRATE